MYELEPGAKIGPFIIERHLPDGQGGMASVYLAKMRDRFQNTSLPERVALKVSFAEYHDFLKQETGYLQHLQHPHIVQIYPLPNWGGQSRYLANTATTTRQVYYFAMEYLSGGSLAELLEKKGRLSARRSVVIARQIASALDHMHQQQIVNLDIKPNNILFRRRRGDWFRADSPQAVLCDFGIARWVGQPGLGLRVGTPPYLSPEQVAEMGRNSSLTTDYRSDIFLMGILLYEMLTGQEPFDDNIGLIGNPAYMPPPPSQKVSGIPAALDDIIMRALAKQMSDRYQSAKEMLADLEKIRLGPDLGLAGRWLLAGMVPSIVAVSLGWAVLSGAAPWPPNPDATPTPAPTVITVTSTATNTVIPSPTFTLTPEPTDTPTLTVSPTPILSPTVTPAPTRTPTPTRPPPTFTPTSPPTPEQPEEG